MKRRPAPPSERRSRGLGAEDAAAAFLEAQGWRVLDRNHHSRFGEIDLIVEKGDTIAFVEVRSRIDPSFAHPLESISWQKRRRILRTAMDWAHRNKMANSHYMRFDVIAILGAGEGATIEHYEAAFDGEGLVF